MPTIARVRAGSKAVRGGAQFEIQFQTACLMESLQITKIPSGCKTFGRGNLVRVKTPFDFIVSTESKTAFLDTKTTAGKTFPKSMIEDHQVDEMVKHSCVSGYVVQFRELNQVVFFTAKVLDYTRRSPVIRSLCLADGVTIFENGRWNIRKMFNKPIVG